MSIVLSSRRAPRLELLLIVFLSLLASLVFALAITGAANAQNVPESTAPMEPAATPSAVAASAKPENQFLQRNQEVVANWIAQCWGAPSVHDLPRRYATALGVYEWSFSVNDTLPDFPAVSEEVIKNQHLLSPQKMAAWAITRVIYGDSLDAIENARSFESQAFLLQLAIIGLGILTTVFSSLNSARLWAEEGLTSRFIKILAIVFPALTTAGAAMNTFINPTERAAVERRNLAALSQLGDRIAQEVWLLSCKDGPANELWLTGWRQRLQDIANGANTTATKGNGSESANTKVNPK